ncbi:MAG: hypothetical protein C4576_21475 [Desulfobacteraceae bacterium]|nr:MAG: hypothetical protein C4576_21475 [Desulfobacteraceae bacterium]
MDQVSPDFIQEMATKAPGRKNRMKVYQYVMRGLGFMDKGVFTIALIGADGAGKSTMAHRLRRSFPLPLKYLYMGVNPSSSNFVLPTTLLAGLIKGRFGSGNGNLQKGGAAPGSAKGKSRWRRDLRAAARIACLLPEEWYRQLISWIYRARGYCVLYDRHFAVDFEPSRSELQTRYIPVADRLHRWFLARFYPRPDLVVFLDAPPHILLARKGEGSLSYFNERRRAFFDQQKRMPNFTVIDASLPEDEVYHRLFLTIAQFYEKRTGRSSMTDLNAEGMSR